MDRKYKHLMKNSVLLLIGNFASKILSFVMVPFYTSILSTSDYGVADLISTTVILVLPLFSVLMDESLMRYTLDNKVDEKQAVTIASLISGVGFIVFLAFSPIVLIVKTLRPFYSYIVLYYFVSWVYNLVSSYARGKDLVKLVALGGIIHTVLFAGLNIVLLATIKMGVQGYLIAINASNILTTAFLFIGSKMYKNYIPAGKIDLKLAKSMICYSVPMIPNYISWWVNTSSDRYMLTMFCGTAANGVYSVAGKIPTMLSTFTSVFASAWRISSVDNFGSKESILFYNNTFKIYSGVLLVGASSLVYLTEILAKFLYAKEFFIAWRITPFLILAYVVCALANFVESIFNASKKTKTLFYASTCGAVFNIAMNIILIPRYEGVGAAIATICSYILILVLDMINTRKIIKIDFNLKTIIISCILVVFEIVFIQTLGGVGYYFALACLVGVFAQNKKVFSLCINIIANRKKRRK